MKQFMSLLTASVIIGFVIYLVSYFVFSFDKTNAVIIAVSGALGGFAAEYLRPLFISLSKNKARGKQLN